MAPKFRGGSDDWLDDEDSASGGGTARTMKKPSKARAQFLPAAEANGTVSEVHPQLCRVVPDGQPVEAGILCAYRRAGLRQDTESRDRNYVTVGDRVKFSAQGSQGVVEGMCERRNSLTRPAPGREGGKMFQAIAANLDGVVIVASATSPAFSPGLVDRFLIATQAAGIAPLICVTKLDAADATSQARPWELYSKLGFPVREVSARSLLGVAELRAELSGQTILFCGQSGVGKTSLLRVLLESEIGKVAEISEMTGKGKHTTTSAVLLGGPGDSRWIDSPGIREFGLVGVAPEKLAALFPEFGALACRVASCQHVGEEGCRAVELPRHASYLRIYESLKAGEN